MPIHCTIDHDKRFVSVTAEGPVVLQDVLDYFDRVVIESAASYPKLFDATKAEPRFSDEDVMVLGARVSAYAAFEPRGPLALVGGSEETMNLLRRFMNLGQAKREAMLFRHVKDARNWLSEIAAVG